MPLIDTPSPAAVVDRLNLPPARFGFKDKSEITALLNETRLLDSAIGMVETQADDAAAPYDFPFDDTLIAEAKPLWTPEMRLQRSANQQAHFFAAIINIAASELAASAPPRSDNTGNDPLKDRIKVLRDSGNAALAAGVQSVRAMVILTNAGQGAETQRGHRLIVAQPAVSLAIKPTY